MPTETRYTFGDGDVAALRLRLLAETYAPSSAALLAALGEVRGGVLDLGCGPGHTTELLAAALRPTWTVGLDRSARLVEAARARLPALRFLVHDVMAAPFPAAPAAVVYARFLLTHLSDPVAALRGWGVRSPPGGGWSWRRRRRWSPTTPRSGATTRWWRRSRRTTGRGCGWGRSSPRWRLPLA